VAGRVVPSAKDGLHCGHTPLRRISAVIAVVPSAKDGLHCGRARIYEAGMIAEVVPSAKDGLHCGSTWNATQQGG